MSEPISDVSTTKGASFILENLAFFERQRQRRDALLVTENQGMIQLQTPLETLTPEIWVLITYSLRTLHW